MDLKTWPDINISVIQMMWCTCMLGFCACVWGDVVVVVAVFIRVQVRVFIVRRESNHFYIIQAAHVKSQACQKVTVGLKD